MDDDDSFEMYCNARMGGVPSLSISQRLKEIGPAFLHVGSTAFCRSCMEGGRSECSCVPVAPPMGEPDVIPYTDAEIAAALHPRYPLRERS